MTRWYREQSAIMGQTSPPLLGMPALSHVLGASVADVGCGSGLFGYMMRAAWQWTGSWQTERIAVAQRLIGVDWSPSTVKTLREHGPYDDVILADSTVIPLADGEVDTALSMENLEHLLPSQVPTALRELARVSTCRVVVTTPAPWAVVNDDFLDREIGEARADREPLGYDEAMNLIGQVHKSSVTPEQMEAAGFDCHRNRLGAAAQVRGTGSIVYTGEPDRLNVDQLGAVVGIPWQDYPVNDGREDWSAVYLDCLQASQAMRVRRRAPWQRRLSVLATTRRNWQHD